MEGKSQYYPSLLLRYMAICHPLSPLSRSSAGQAKKIIAWIWLISFMSAFPWALFTKVNYLVYNGKIVEESAWCSIPFNEETTGSLYMMLGSTVIYFFVPMVVVTLLYTRYVYDQGILASSLSLP